MKSRITIEVDFARNNQPVIKVLKRNSDDVRDNLLKSFFEQLGGQSNWCRVDIDHYNDDPLDAERRFDCWHITPVKSENLKEQSGLMFSAYNNVNKAAYVDYFADRPSNRQDLMSPAEKAIMDAMYKVEEIEGGSETLTAAVILLSNARQKVYDHYMMTRMAK